MTMKNTNQILVVREKCILSSSVYRRIAKVGTEQGAKLVARGMFRAKMMSELRIPRECVGVNRNVIVSV